jgi:glycerol-3-phosphate responsive antiterminator
MSSAASRALSIGGSAKDAVDGHERARNSGIQRIYVLDTKGPKQYLNIIAFRDPSRCDLLPGSKWEVSAPK